MVRKMGPKKEISQEMMEMKFQSMKVVFGECISSYFVHNVNKYRCSAVIPMISDNIFLLFF